MTSRTTVLFIGLDPAALGLDDSGPGPTATSIQHGIDTSMSRLDEAGFAATWLGLPGAENAAELTLEAMRTTSFDCAVIGAGIRLLPQNTALLETLIRAIQDESPTTRIAFNTSASDSLAAVERHFPARTP